MPKPKVAFYWCASCGGCEETVVDLAEDILGVVEKVDIVLWPVAMDFKYKDVEAMADKSIFATLLNGAIRSSEQEAMARLLRRKSRYLIAYGSCACTGGIPGAGQPVRARADPQVQLRGRARRWSTRRRRGPSWSSRRTAAGRTCPSCTTSCARSTRSWSVDYYIPGCPPTPKITKAAVAALLDGRLPPKGAVLAPDIALCEECPRRDSKPTDVAFTEFKRTHQKLLDPQLCLLAQGVVCMGPATRQGCGAQCLSGNMPCTGCFGGTDRVKDQGAKILSSLCANIAREGGGRRSTRCWRASPIRSAPSTATGWRGACCGARWISDGRSASRQVPSNKYK